MKEDLNFPSFFCKRKNIQLEDFLFFKRYLKKKKGEEEEKKGG
jgi:hypothetical protein